jgi:hypothetical protein
MDFSLSNEQMETFKETIKFDERSEVVKRAMILMVLHYGLQIDAGAVVGH